MTYNSLKHTFRFSSQPDGFSIINKLSILLVFISFWAIIYVENLWSSNVYFSPIVPFWNKYLAPFTFPTFSIPWRFTIDLFGYFVHHSTVEALNVEQRWTGYVCKRIWIDLISVEICLFLTESVSVSVSHFPIHKWKTVENFERSSHNVDRS